MRFRITGFLLIYFWAFQVLASQPGDPLLPRFAEARLGFSQVKSHLGGHVGGTYGFEVNPRFFLGIDTGLRRLAKSGSSGLSLLSYGLLLRHRVLESQLPHAGLFLQYGLLFRMIFEQGVSGYAQAHETELGALWAHEAGWFFKISYSISKLRYFALPPRPLSGMDGVVGYAWRW